MSPIYNWVNWIFPSFMDFLVLFCMPFSIELVFPEQILIWVSLVISFEIQTFEWVQTGFTLFCFETRQVDFKIFLTALNKVTVVFDLIRSIAFDIFRSLSSAYKGSMSPFLVVPALGDARIHVGPMNGSNS